MKAEPVFRGVAVALVTLFDESLELDAEGTAELAVRLVDLGVKAVVVGGTTGEAAALDPEERSELLAAVRKALPQGSGVPVIAGTGAPSARQAARLTSRGGGPGGRRRIGAITAGHGQPAPLLRSGGGGRERPSRICLPLPIGLGSRHFPLGYRRPSGRRYEGFEWRRGPAPGDARHVGPPRLPRKFSAGNPRRSARLPGDNPGVSKCGTRGMRFRLRRRCSSSADTGRAAPPNRGPVSGGPQRARGGAVRVLHEVSVGLETGAGPATRRLSDIRDRDSPAPIDSERELHEPGQQPQSSARRPRSLLGLGSQTWSASGCA